MPFLLTFLQFVSYRAVLAGQSNAPSRSVTVLVLLKIKNYQFNSVWPSARVASTKRSRMKETKTFLLFLIFFSGQTYGPFSLSYREIALPKKGAGV